MALLQLSANESCILLNVYCPSGWDKDTLTDRANVMTAVLTELQACGNSSVIVMGDFNEYVHESILAGPLKAAGWGLPLLVGTSHTHPAPTYKCGDIESSLDGILLSANLMSHMQPLEVSFVDGFQHACVSMQLDATCQ
eukprot:1145882-Amphidinium_carterae.1